MVRKLAIVGAAGLASQLCMGVTIQQAMPAQGSITGLYGPVINSNGLVAFVGYNSATSSYSVNTWNGSTLSNISASGYTSFSRTGIDLNDSGNVAYIANKTAGSAVVLNSTPIYTSTNSNDYSTSDSVAISSTGMVAFTRRTTGDTGQYLGNGSSTTLIFNGNTQLIASPSKPTVNASNLVAFPASDTVGSSTYAALFTSSAAPAKTLIIDGTDTKLRIPVDPSIDAAGDILFRSDYQTGQGSGTGLFLKRAGQSSYTELVAPATTAFTMVQSAAIAPDGTYAFLAVMDDSSRAIYYGKDGSLSLLISSTQLLNGQSISNFSFNARGISSDDRIVFGVTPASGNPSVYYAQVPEPGIASMIGMTTLGLLARRKERRVEE